MSFFSSSFKAEVKRAVAEAERETSAEIVVAVRPESASYRHVDFAVGTAAALAVLCVFLYHPAEFEFTYLPLELALAWGLGVLLSVSAPPLRRALTRERLRDASVELAASAAFVDCGVHRTRGRTGILVLVSSFERRSAVRADVGVPVGELEPEWSRWTQAIEAAASRADAPAFLEAIRKAGPLLRDALPRAADDTNELPDDANEAA